MPVYTLNVNNKDYTVNVSSSGMPLLWAIRDVIGLTGTKYGCGITACGACTVLINGEAKKTCDMDVSSAVGKKITTIEGLADAATGVLHPAQQAWINHQVPQCGYCQSGVLMCVAGAMKAGKHGAELASNIENLCVCGTYARMNKAAATL